MEKNLTQKQLASKIGMTGAAISSYESGTRSPSIDSLCKLAAFFSTSVWSNYGIEGAKDKNTSLNYLAAQVLTAAGVPTNAYQNYLLSLSKTYPVISAAGQTKGIGADEKQLQTYKKLQYYQLFEKNKEKDE